MKEKKKIILLMIIVFIILALIFTELKNILTLQNLKENRDILEGYVKENYTLSVIIYVLIYIITIALNIPGAIILTLSGSFLFGMIQTFFYAIFGATTGATIGFLMSRYFIGNYVQKKYDDKLIKINKEINENGASYLLTLRLLPGFPFFLVNLLAGLTNIKVFTFIWVTIIGMVPGTLVFSFAGSNLRTINSINDIMSSRMIITFILLALLTLIPTILKKFKKIYF